MNEDQAPSGQPVVEAKPEAAKVIPLEERLANRRAAADKAERDNAYGLPHAGVKVDAKDPKPAAVAKPAAPKVEEPPKVDEKIAAEHARVVAEKDAKIAEHESVLAEWDEVAEQASARIDALKSYVARLEATLKQRGIGIDPRDVEIMRHREAEAARKMQDERVKAIVAQQEAEAAKARDQAASDARVAGYIAVTNQYPHLNPQTDDGRKFWLMVANADPRTGQTDPLPPEVAARIAATWKPTPVSRVAAPLRQSGPVGGGAEVKSSDPRDIADKWKRKLAS